MHQNNKATWKHSHNWKPERVEKEGKLKAVIKFLEPIDETSLLEYNKDFKKRAVEITRLDK